MKITLLILMFIASISVRAQAPFPLLQNVENRNITTLDGSWDIIIDPLENGYYNYRYKVKEDGFFINQKEESGSPLEYNFDTGHQLQVPGDWNTQMEKLYYYEGTVWYKRSFNYAKQEGNRVFVYFGAVNYDSKIYLNGKKLGDHIGGYTSFNFEITDLLKEKDNFLVVKVDNTRKKDGIPMDHTDWWNYGGITRSVHLVETTSTFVNDYFIQLEKGSDNKVTGYVQLDKPVKKEVSIAIPELKINQKFTTDNNGKALVTFNAKFEKWSPHNPKLYAVKITSGKDALTDFIGFRSLATEDHKIILNGKPIFLKGISIHEESPFGTGRVTIEEECEVLVKWAKELGCNYVRLAHYPHSEQMVKVAERNGLMIWSEIPVYWTVHFGNEATYANAENQLEEMIARDKNRAAIILWSVANETPPGEDRLKFLTKLVKKTKKLDNTRLTTAALENHSTEQGTIELSDALGNELDVLGFNQYCGWYWGKPTDCDKMDWLVAFNKPLVISEFGGGALQGLHGASTERWTEEYQDVLYKYNLSMMTKIDELAGITPWLLKDFLSPRRALSRIQNDFNRKGLISERGIKKTAYYRVQSFYQSYDKYSK